VVDGLEPGKKAPGDALRWGVGVEEIGVRFLQIGQLAHEEIVLAVGDLGLTRDVVQMVVPLDLPAEALDFLGRGLAHQSVE
jgi:hypothetical protein